MNWSDATLAFFTIHCAVSHVHLITQTLPHTAVDEASMHYRILDAFCLFSFLYNLVLVNFLAFGVMLGYCGTEYYHYDGTTAFLVHMCIFLLWGVYIY